MDKNNAVFVLKLKNNVTFIFMIIEANLKNTETEI